MKEVKENETAKRYGQMRSEFILLESKFHEWFDERDTFIAEYFVENDFRKGFREDANLPEMIKVECAVIMSKYSL